MTQCAEHQIFVRRYTPIFPQGEKNPKTYCTFNGLHQSFPKT